MGVGFISPDHGHLCNGITLLFSLRRLRGNVFFFCDIVEASHPLSRDWTPPHSPLHHTHTLSPFLDCWCELADIPPPTARGNSLRCRWPLCPPFSVLWSRCSIYILRLNTMTLCLGINSALSVPLTSVFSPLLYMETRQWWSWVKERWDGKEEQKGIRICETWLKSISLHPVTTGYRNLDWNPGSTRSSQAQHSQLKWASRASWALFLLRRVRAETQAECKVLSGKKHSRSCDSENIPG